MKITLPNGLEFTRHGGEIWLQNGQHELCPDTAGDDLINALVAEVQRLRGRVADMNNAFNHVMCPFPDDRDRWFDRVINRAAHVTITEEEQS